MSQDNKIFPLLDRPAPLIGNIRAEQDETVKIANDISTLIVDAIKSDDDEKLSDASDTMSEALKERMADEFGVSTNDISDEFVNEITNMLILSDEKDVLTSSAAERLGIKVDNGDEDNDTNNEDDSPQLFDD